MKLTFEEKVALLDGADVWHTKVFEGLPSIMMTDGPHGLRKQVESTDALGISGSVKATAFPTASLTACSFDRELIATMAELIAIEAKANEVNMVLGPGINMKRSPLCGRNFEYFSEDPFLAGELGAAYVRAMEDQNIGTSVKHFFCNNQEKNRFTIDCIVDDRALREIYLKAFKRVIKENPGSVMASYNKINGFYATESPVLSDMLRNEWQYEGVVVSDWGAINHREKSLLASCDLEMPSSRGYHTDKIIQAALLNDKIGDAVEKSSRRISNMVNRYHQSFHESFSSSKHHNAARIIARESMVLLKNEDILPLDKKDKVLIVGGFIDDIRYQGGGSSHINPTHLDQIKDIYSAYSDQIVVSKGYGLIESKDDDELSNEACKLAMNADKIVCLLGLPDSYETEGFDRKTLELPQNQKRFIKELVKINPNLIVVGIAGSVIKFDFEPQVKGLLMAYLGGQSAAAAIMDLLYGIENPSGRLAETFIDDINDCNVQLTNDNHSVYYDESIFIGYRYYNTFNKEVHYPFGYGLSYTTFEYSNMSIQEAEHEFVMMMDIKNVGKMKGKEVIQIYLENNQSTVFKAHRELKGFDKILIEPDQVVNVMIRVDKSEFSYYDIYQNQWMIEKGTYKLLIAKNVNEIIQSFDIDLEGSQVTHPKLSYQDENYNIEDFNKIYSKALPKKNIKYKRPYTLSSTLNDIRKTFFGRILAYFIVKEGMKTTEKMEENWMKEVAKATLTETPLRMLSLFSDGKFPLILVEGLIDIINFRLIKGFKKIRKKSNKNMT
ncbi:MAG: glycoside hydrolase family 3 C-terminal domain-containing protein [Acholeplasmataceae bacterium]|nr:glycoside hydrolase family 3 C-terminal domain-containing protein [Acholeplasmataceae bacterium]